MDQLIKVSLRPQGKREPLYTVGGNAGYKAVRTTEWKFLKSLKIELLQDPLIPLLGLQLKGMKSVSQRDICTPMLIATVFTVVKIQEQPRCPLTDKWIKKL